MKPQLFAVDLMLLCVSCAASALATSAGAASTSSPAANFTSLGAARGYGTDTTTISKIRRKRYISQNDMLAILDYHNKVRGKVFPPASNMEYMVSESFHSNLFSRCTGFHSMHNIPAAMYCISDFFFLLLSCVCSASDQTARIKYNHLSLEVMESQILINVVL